MIWLLSMMNCNRMANCEPISSENNTHEFGRHWTPVDCASWYPRMQIAGGGWIMSHWSLVKPKKSWFTAMDVSIIRPFVRQYCSANCFTSSNFVGEFPFLCTSATPFCHQRTTRHKNNVTVWNMGKWNPIKSWYTTTHSIKMTFACACELRSRTLSPTKWERKTEAANEASIPSGCSHRANKCV